MGQFVRAAVALGAMALAGGASAQSSVTLFGVLDANVQHIKGTASVTGMGGGGINGSRIGFRGTEDLGGGLAAGFHLEAGLNVDAGTTRASSANNITSAGGGGLTFNRRSTVQMRGPFGEVRLGRDYTPVADNHTDFDIFGNSGVGDASNLTQALAIGLVAGTGVKTDIRASNAITYYLPPKLGGVYGAAMLAMSENRTAAVAAQRKDGRHVGARVGWSNAAFNVALAYGSTTLAAQDDLDNVHLGAAYKLGSWEFMGQLSRERTTVAGNRHTNDAAALGAAYAMGPGVLRAEVTRAVIERATGADIAATMLAAGYVYNFSKRTALYATVSRIANRDAGTFDLGQAVVAGRNATGAQFGVRHRF